MNVAMDDESLVNPLKIIIDKNYKDPYGTFERDDEDLPINFGKV